MLTRGCSGCCVLPGACRVGPCGTAGLHERGGMGDVSPTPRDGQGLGQHQGMTMHWTWGRSGTARWGAARCRWDMWLHRRGHPAAPLT